MFDTFQRDVRAIEGLPIRLVIALVIGVASLSVMMNMLTGIQGLSITELDAEPSPEVVAPGQQQLTFTVVGTDGTPVSDATVVVEGESADIGGVETATTDVDGVATVTVSPTLRPNQGRGTLRVDIKPPANSQYTDRRENANVLVVREA